MPSDFLSCGTDVIILSSLTTKPYLLTECLAETDFILHCFDIVRTCSYREMEFISHYLDNKILDKTLFTVNRLELIPEKEIESVKEYVISRLSPYMHHPIFFLRSKTDFENNDIRTETTDSEWNDFKNYINVQLNSQLSTIDLGKLIQETSSQITNFLYSDAPLAKTKLQNELMEITDELSENNDKLQLIREKLVYKGSIKLSAIERIDKRLRTDIKDWMESIGHVVNKRLLDSIPNEPYIKKTHININDIKAIANYVHKLSAKLIADEFMLFLENIIIDEIKHDEVDLSAVYNDIAETLAKSTNHSPEQWTFNITNTVAFPQEKIYKSCEDFINRYKWHDIILHNALTGTKPFSKLESDSLFNKPEGKKIYDAMSSENKPTKDFMRIYSGFALMIERYISYPGHLTEQALNIPEFKDEIYAGIDSIYNNCFEELSSYNDLAQHALKTYYNTKTDICKRNIESIQAKEEMFHKYYAELSSILFNMLEN